MELFLDKTTQSFNFSQKECEIFQVFENCCRNFSRFIPLLNQDQKSMNDLFSTIEVIKEKILTNEKVFNQICEKHKAEKNKLEEEILILQKDKIEQVNFLNSEIKRSEREYKETFLQRIREKENLQNENNSLKNTCSENANEIKLLKGKLTVEKKKNQKELEKYNNLEEKIKKMEKEHAEAIESSKIHFSKQNTQLLDQEIRLEGLKELKDQNAKLTYSIQEKEKNLNENFLIIKKLSEVKANLEEKNFSLNSIIQVFEKEKENQIREYQMKLQELSDEKRSLVEIKEKDDLKIKNFNEKIQEIEERNSSLGMEITFFEKRMKSLVTQNEELLNEKNALCSKTNSLEEKNNILINENNLIANNLIEIQRKYDEIRYSKLTNKMFLDEFSQDREINMNEKKKRSNKKPEKNNIIVASPRSILKEDKSQKVDPNNMIIIKSESVKTPQDERKKEIIESNQKEKIGISEEEINKPEKIKESTEKINEILNKNQINESQTVELRDNGDENSSNSSKVGSNNSLLFANPNPREYDFEDYDSNCSSDFGSKIRKGKLLIFLLLLFLKY